MKALVAAALLSLAGCEQAADPAAGPADGGDVAQDSASGVGADISDVPGSTADAPAGDAAIGDAPPGDVPPAIEPALTPARVHERHAALRDTLIAHLARPGSIFFGDWVGDYGDAPMYGPAFDLRWWDRTGDEAHLERALAALEFDRVLVENAAANPLELAGGMEPIAMALLGLLEAGQVLDEERWHAAADALIGVLDPIVQGMGDYLDASVGAFGSGTYGPTAISAFLALMHLEHALAYPQHDLAHHLERAREVLDHIHERAWDDALGAYRFAPDEAKLFLYPNVTVMLACGRMWELSRDPEIAARIVAIRKGIEPLRDPTGDHWHSPYSAEYMGAKTEDYSTLSSQNYLMLAFTLGFRATGDLRLLEDVDRVLGFLETHLLVDGRLVHHWMDGAPAHPDHNEYYCTGCNLQTLFALMLLE